MPVQNAEIAAMFDQTADLLEILTRRRSKFSLIKFSVLRPGFSVLRKYFPVLLRREFASEALQRRHYLESLARLKSRFYKIPC